MIDKLSNLSLPASKQRLNQVFCIVGALTLILGAILSPARIWMNLLLVSYALVGIGLGGLFFIALQYITSAGWSVVIRRIPEAMTAVLPVGAAGLIIVFIFHPSLYSWTLETVHLTGKVFNFKHFWLNRPFFLMRSALYLGIWIFMARAIVRNSRQQDKDGLLEHSKKNYRLSAIFLVVYAITFWLASFDWIMSLEPDWYSTIFGVYNFAGMFQSGLAMLIVLVVWLSREGPLRGIITAEHLHDLGKLLFAFSTFWMYIWFCQYMLIWYANFPEEAIYFTRRIQGAWKPLMILNLFLNWVVPFLVLLPVATKRNPNTLVRVSLAVLAGRWLDLYLMIAPSSNANNPAFGIWEAGLILGTIGILGLMVRRGLNQASLIPLKDPYLYESLHHHQ